MTDTDEAVDKILDAVVQAAPQVRAGLWERRGSEIDIDHPTGDAVIGADVFADEVFFDHLTDLSVVGAYASEDREEAVDLGDGFAVTVDPLDGSSNVASNNLVGSIIGVYDGELPAGGDAMVAAAYLVYGPITTMVVAVDDTVTELAVTEAGARRLRRDVTLPSDPVVYGFGGKDPDWTPAFATFAAEIRDELKLRYGGAMIGDVNQVLSYGGMFAYPALRDTPRGNFASSSRRYRWGTSSRLQVVPHRTVLTLSLISTPRVCMTGHQCTSATSDSSTGWKSHSGEGSAQSGVNRSFLSG